MVYMLTSILLYIMATHNDYLEIVHTVNVSEVYVCRHFSS